MSFVSPVFFGLLFFGYSIEDSVKAAESSWLNVAYSVRVCKGFVHRCWEACYLR